MNRTRNLEILLLSCLFSGVRNNLPIRSLYSDTPETSCIK